MRAQPAREDLRLFVERVASLDGARVAELLQAKMVPACRMLCYLMRPILHVKEQEHPSVE
jgi:hypothetical protein